MMFLVVFLINYILTAEKLNTEQGFDLKKNITDENSIFDLKFEGIRENNQSDKLKYEKFTQLFEMNSFMLECCKCQKSILNRAFWIHVLNFPTSISYENEAKICYGCLKNLTFEIYSSEFVLLHTKILFKKWVLVFPQIFAVRPLILKFKYFTKNLKLKVLELFFDYEIKNLEIFLVRREIFDKIKDVDIIIEGENKNIKQFFSLTKKILILKRIDIFENISNIPKSLKIMSESDSKNNIFKSELELDIENNTVINEIRIKINSAGKGFRYMDIIGLNIETRNIIKILKKMTNFEVYENLKINFKTKKKLLILYNLRKEKFNFFDIYTNKINYHLGYEVHMYAAYITSTLFFIILLENNIGLAKLALNKNFESYHLTSQEHSFNNIVCYYGTCARQHTISMPHIDDIIDQFDESAYEILRFTLKLAASLQNLK